jgi:hypothetical protein
MRSLGSPCLPLGPSRFTGAAGAGHDPDRGSILAGSPGPCPASGGLRTPGCAGELPGRETAVHCSASGSRAAPGRRDSPPRPLRMASRIETRRTGRRERPLTGPAQRLEYMIQSRRRAERWGSKSWRVCNHLLRSPAQGKATAVGIVENYFRFQMLLNPLRRPSAEHAAHRATRTLGEATPALPGRPRRCTPGAGGRRTLPRRGAGLSDGRVGCR